ncbi:hypothetical protein QCA50_014989 [Cerrena zonata]|uniref:EamA domain-containing protein n=1 Tax=Cerrena zonata TaxID=2478898 RepID=A0AAW0FT36_9APHY
MTSINRTTYFAGTPVTTTIFSVPYHELPDEGEDLPNSAPSTRRTTTRRVEMPGPLRRLYMGTRETIQNNTGMLLIAASQAFFSLMNVAVKKLNSLENPVPALELIVVRMGITWICCVSYMMIAKVPDPFLGPKGVRLLLATRGFVGFFGLFGIYYSLQYLSLSDATVLTFLAPMLTCITGAVLLKEDFHWKQAIAGLCSLLGVILIARPDFLFGHKKQESVMHPVEGVEIDFEIDMQALNPIDSVSPHQRLVAVGVALIGVCGATGAYTTIRAIGKRAHPMHNLVSFSSQCVVVAVIAMLVLQTPIVLPTQLDFVAMLIMIGLFGFCAQFLLTLGLQRETASRGTMAVYIQIIFATAFEKLFFHTTPTPLSIIGTIIIMSSAIYVAATKENTGAKKRAQSQAASREDITLEEGLLAHQESLDEVDGQKGAVSIPLQEVAVSKEAETRQVETPLAKPNAA